MMRTSIGCLLVASLAFAACGGETDDGGRGGAGDGPPAGGSAGVSGGPGGGAAGATGGASAGAAGRGGTGAAGIGGTGIGGGPGAGGGGAGGAGTGGASSGVASTPCMGYLLGDVPECLGYVNVVRECCGRAPGATPQTAEECVSATVYGLAGACAGQPQSVLAQACDNARLRYMCAYP